MKGNDAVTSFKNATKIITRVLLAGVLIVVFFIGCQPNVRRIMKEEAEKGSSLGQLVQRLMNEM